MKIIYIPLTREQGASTILIDLLETSDLLQRLDSGTASLQSNSISAARKWSTSLVQSHFPKKWSGEEVLTDKSVLDAVLLIGQAYASLSKTVFFANESWTVPHTGKYYVLYQTPEYGVVTSATGNDGTTKLWDFAQRAPSNKDTMAIVNMNVLGVVPQSTRIQEGDIDVAMAAGFDGMVTDDVSGTSFSAPRIAWFLAAGETVRSAPLNLDHWGVNLFEQLHGMRSSNATGYEKLLFDPVKYVEMNAGTQ